ncbi:MAG: 2-oxoacid:acceptor oxidoreductase subunit alpha [Gammaproteobacteria bacterium]
MIDTGQKVNEFSIRFANVNGSGSASANQLFAQSMFRMGLPISVKNIFPSNIQGAPTWFEVRISEADFLARSESVDIAVAMNPQTYAQDLACLRSGGVFLYDSSFPRKFDRDDVQVVGVPLMQLCLDVFGNVKQRHLLKNIAYCGALGALLEVPPDVMEQVIQQTFAGKSRLIEPNKQALELGYDWINTHMTSADRSRFPIRVKQSKALGDRILISGNDAAGLGAVYGGATVAAWYPITPSTSLAEAFTEYSDRYRKDAQDQLRVAIIQAEDELAAAGIVLGAGWNGARAFTATSGPGVSLMSEFIGLAYMAEVPFVLFNIQRGGPSTGMPTRTQQSDILSCAYASHGDTLHPLLFPADPKECFEMSAQAFDLADRFQTPIIVMSDLDLGMNDWVCDPFEWQDDRVWDRGKIMSAEALDQQSDWGRYLDMDGDGVPWRSLPGTHPEKGAYLSRGTSHDEYGRYTEDGDVHARVLERINKKIAGTVQYLPEPEYSPAEIENAVALLYFGTTAVAVPEAMSQLGNQGGGLDLIRIRAFPFSEALLQRLQAYTKIVVAEQNRDGQMAKLLVAEGGIDPDKIESVCLFDGMPVTASSLCKGIQDLHLFEFEASKMARSKKATG